MADDTQAVDRSNETLNIYDKDSKLVVKGDKGTKKAEVTGLKHGQVVADGDYLSAYQDVTSQAESDKAPVPGWTVLTVAPSNPTVKLTAGDGKIDFAITAPADDGGSKITGYNVYVKGSADIWPAAPTQQLTPDKLTGTIDKLTDGSEYTVAVTAVNDKGESSKDADGASNHATPAAPKPAAPANNAAAPTDQGADVTAQ